MSYPGSADCSQVECDFSRTTYYTAHKTRRTAATACDIPVAEARDISEIIRRR